MENKKASLKLKQFTPPPPPKNPLTKFLIISNLILLFSIIIGIITFSGGWHIPEEILSGTFRGTYNFSNNVTFQNNLNYEIEGTFTSCKDILEKSFEFSKLRLNSGIYKINPSGNDEFEVYCDMITDGGGFTLAIRLNTNDENSRIHNDTDFWSSNNEIGNLQDNKDYLSKAFNEIVFNEISLNYKYKNKQEILAIFSNSQNTNTLKQNVNLQSSNSNPIWNRTFIKNSKTDLFFGEKLIFQTIGNGDINPNSGFDYSRIWYNKLDVSACNQGGSIGHIGDYQCLISGIGKLLVEVII